MKLISKTRLTRAALGAAVLSAGLWASAASAAPASWTGCYLGGNVGGGWAHTDMVRTGKIDGSVVTPADFGRQDDSGFLGGGQVGCDFQAGAWVIGGRGMFDFGEIKGSNVIPAFTDFTAETKSSNFDTLNARIGYAVTPSLLIYAQGGAAWQNQKITIISTTPTVFVSETASNDRTGYDLGGGAEWMFAPHWSAFVDYSYADFGRKSVTFVAAPGLVNAADIVSTRQNTQSVAVGVNFRL